MGRRTIGPLKKIHPSLPPCECVTKLIPYWCIVGFVTCLLICTYCVHIFTVHSKKPEGMITKSNNSIRAVFDRCCIWTEEDIYKRSIYILAKYIKQNKTQSMLYTVLHIKTVKDKAFWGVIFLQQNLLSMWFKDQLTTQGGKQLWRVTKAFLVLTTEYSKKKADSVRKKAS